MKILIPFLSALFFASTLYAQDILTLKSGEKMSVKVIEITDTQVKFKKANNPDGPLYNYSKSSVLKVQYANGTNEEFTNTYTPGPYRAYDSLPKTEMRRYLATGVVFAAIGCSMEISGIPLIAIGTMRNQVHFSNGNGYIIGGCIIMIFGGGLLTTGAINLHKYIAIRKVTSRNKGLVYMDIPMPVVNYSGSGYGGFGLGTRLVF